MQSIERPLALRPNSHRCRRKAEQVIQYSGITCARNKRIDTQTGLPQGIICHHLCINEKTGHFPCIPSNENSTLQNKLRLPRPSGCQFIAARMGEESSIIVAHCFHSTLSPRDKVKSMILNTITVPRPTAYHKFDNRGVFRRTSLTIGCTPGIYSSKYWAANSVRKRKRGRRYL